MPVGTIIGALPPVAVVAPTPVPAPPVVAAEPPVALFCPPGGVAGVLEQAANAADRHSSDENGIKLLIPNRCMVSPRWFF
jgi:hypothetical protein